MAMRSQRELLWEVCDPAVLTNAANHRHTTIYTTTIWYTDTLTAMLYHTQTTQHNTTQHNYGHIPISPLTVRTPLSYYPCLTPLLTVVPPSTLDPVFAVFIGTSAYYTFEQRVGRQPGHTLNELVAKRYRQWSQDSGAASPAEKWSNADDTVWWSSVAIVGVMMMIYTGETCV